MNKKKVAVVLSGCGVYDGAEIHESVLSLLALDKAGLEVICIAPNRNQHHVINHTNGQEMQETRNVLVEAARIARGNIKELDKISVNDFDALYIPGGFGTAKNFTKWAFSGPDGQIESDIKNIIVETVKAKKPLVALCMSPTTVAKALEGSSVQAVLTIGTTKAKSEYDIEGIGGGMEKVGSHTVEKNVDEVAVDTKNKIITTPCYMMDASISQIYTGIEKAVNSLVEMLGK